MFKLKNFTITIFTTLLLCITAYFIVVFASKKTHIKKQTEKFLVNSKTPEIIIKNLTLQETTNAKHDTWILTSKEGRIFKKTNEIECKDSVCSLIRNNKEIATLKSIKSLVNRNSKNIFLNGPVDGNFSELEFYGQDVNYNFSNQTIKTDKSLTYNYPNFSLTAQKSVFDLKENKIEMDGGIKSEILNNPTSNNRRN